MRQVEDPGSGDEFPGGPGAPGPSVPYTPPSGPVVKKKSLLDKIIEFLITKPLKFLQKLF